MTFEEWVKKNKAKDNQSNVNWGGANNRATPAQIESKPRNLDEWLTAKYGTQAQKERYRATHAGDTFAWDKPKEQTTTQRPAQQQTTTNNAARADELRKQIEERQKELDKHGTYTGEGDKADKIGSFWARLSPTNWMPALKGEPTRFETAKTESKRLRDELYELSMELARTEGGSSEDILLKTLEAEGGKLERDIEYLDPGLWDRIFNRDKWKEESAQEAAAREKLLQNRQAQDQLRYSNYLNLMQSADFAQYSKPTGSKVQSAVDGADVSPFGVLTKGDRRYDYINDINGYRGYYLPNTMSANTGEDYSKYEFMNPDEIGVYNYLYNTGGEEKANEYLSVLDDTLNYRYGLSKAKDANTGIEKILYAVPAGLDQFSTGIQQAFKDDALPTTATQYASSAIRQGNKDEGIEGMGAVGGFVYDSVQSMANMAPSILLSSLATAMGAPAVAGQIIGAGTMGLSAAGNAYNEKLKQGFDQGSARTYAMFVGASEATLQYAIGGLSKAGGKLSVGKVANNISAIDNAFGRVALKVGAAAFSEGFEEGLQEILEPIIATLTLSEKYEPAQIEDIAYSFLLGAVSGGMLEGGTVIAEDIQTQRDGKTLAANSAEIINDIIQQGLESERGSTQYQVAVQLRAMLDNGQTLSTYQLGRLYAEMGGVKLSDKTTQPETPIQPEPMQPQQPMQPETEQQMPPELQAELEQAAREAVSTEEITLEDAAREVAQRETAQTNPLPMENQAQRQEQTENVKLPEAEQNPVETVENANAETVADNTTVAAEMPDISKFGENGKKLIETLANETGRSGADVVTEVETAYEAGRADIPMNKVSFVTDTQRIAFNAGRMDAIKENPEITDISKKGVESAPQQEYTDNIETSSGIAQKLQGSDRVIEDGIEYSISQDNSGMFFVNIRRADEVMGGYVSNARSKMYHGGPFNTRADAVAELAAVADNMVSNGITKKEETSNGKEALGEVPDQSGVLEPDVRRESAGGLLDELAPENLQEAAGGGDIVSNPEQRGRETGRPADRSDATGNGRGRSLGDSEGADLQPASREISTQEGANGQEETISDSGDAESPRRVGEEAAGGKGQDLGTVRGRIKEILRRSSAKRREESSRRTRRVETKETREAFEDRVRDEGYTYVETQTGKAAVAFKIAPENNISENAKTASDMLKAWGFDVIVYEGEFLMNAKGITQSSTEANTLRDAGSVTIFISADLSVDGVEAAYHEAFHAARLFSHLKHRFKLVNIIENNIDIDCEAFEAFVNKIADMYSYAAAEMPINSFTDEIVEEFYAWYIGRIHTSDGGDLLDIIKMFSDIETSKAEIDAIYDQMKPGTSETAPKNKYTKAAETAETVAEETTATVTETETEQKAELATQTPDRGVNFTIPESGLQLPKGEKARFKANVEAIKTLKTLMAENRRATPAEQEILSKYVGWGGLANAFDEKKTEWAKEYKQLKNLLTDKEYTSARGSTLNAHYTEIGVIRAMYAGLEKLGFKGGRVLEPSAGVGHFAGAMPQGIDTRWTMVELDEITGNIAKYLYPNADVRVQGFETTKIPDNYMDMAIGNVPFGNYAIADKSYPKAVTSAIHNYFFAKSLDKVREGGIVAFITSRYTMDSQSREVREYIAKRADLLGAIRLPDTAFKGNAGTEVVTDILILKKRKEGTAYGGEDFLNVGSHHYSLGIYEQTNDYFVKHPEMVLGTPAKTGTMYRGNSLTYTAKSGNLAKQIEKAFDSIKGKMDYPVQRTQEEIRAEIKANAGKVKNGSIVKKDGKLYRNNDGVLVEADITKAQEAAVSDIITIRDTARELLNMQLDGASEKQIAEYRKALNSQYDAFVKKNGALNLPKNKRLVQFDIDSPFILALENYDKETKTATKADIFRKNTVTPVKTVTSVNTVEEGLIVSVNETGGVDVNRIAELLGESTEKVTRILLDNRLAFKNRDGKLETAEKYLSGNVKAKLRDAEALAEGDSDYNANVEELKKIIPADIAAEDIAVQPGVTWIPDSVYSDFAAETLGGSNSRYSKDVTVTYNKLLGTFSVVVNNQWLKNRAENTSTWGTPDRSFANILEATLNSKSVTVTRKLEDGSRVVDRQATAAAQEKQEKIKAEFTRWLWDNEQRKETLTKLYNDINNNYVTPKYDGSHLTVNGSNPEKPLREHQKNAVQRIINSGGNTLLAHKVGAGKTYEMAAAAMKLRELGIVKKPMFVVPKSLVAQWGNEFLDFFPAAKILVLGEKDFSAANRKLFANRIATGDYDAVILSQEQFKAVPMSAENQEAFYQEQITALELAIRETARTSGKRDPSIKQMEKSKKSFDAKLKKLGDIKKDTDNIDFEQLGIDAIFVDEAHSYKNLFYSTNMNNVSGLGNKEGSQKAFDMFMKIKYLQELNGGRGIVFATATPVMNSMSEMYIMQRYLQSDLLEARGLHSFDAWAKQFGEVRTVLEMNPSGKGFRQKQSFSRFKNLAELQQMFRAFADVLTDIPGLKIPAMKEGKRIIVESEPSEYQMEYIDKLAERADAVKNRKVDPKDDNMLKITSEGRKLSYTQRMIDPSLPYEEGNKILKAVENVHSIWQESKSIKGTQLIFCDLSTPKGSANTETNTETTEDVEDISIYDDIKNMLVGRGVPAKEIAFIHDADTNEKKSKLFADVNDGKVRVLIGSTGKMGVGMNAQKRIVALHHLDAPWRPGDIEQREGRALRQGNINEEVGMYVYVTKQTFDSRMWDNLQRKATFIHQIMAGDLTARESEGDGDFALSAAEIKAISSGNPLIMEQFEVAADLQRLENLERAHRKEIADAKKRIEKAHLQIASDEVLAQHYREDIKRRQDTTGDSFKLTIGRKVYTERKDAGEALIAEAKRRLDLSRQSEAVTEIGSFAGFKLEVTNSGDIILKGSTQYRITANMQSPGGTVQSLEAQPKRIEKLLEATEMRLSENKQAIPKLEKTVNAPFDKADELERVRKRNAEILAELNPDDEANIAELDGGEEETESEVQHSRGVSSPDRWTAERVGNKDEQPKPLSEIIEGIRHDFGIQITTGHIRGKDKLGQYNLNNQGIRSKVANDLPTVAHELGHHFDNIYGLTKELPDNLKSELENGLDDGMRAAYKEDLWITEGLAEYVRKFLQNHETAAIDYPEFTKYFKSTLSGNDRLLIERHANVVNAYYSLDADTATSSIRLREEKLPDSRTVFERVEDALNEKYQSFVNQNHGIKRLDDATGSHAELLASNAAYSDAMAAQIITGDLTDANGVFVAEGLKTALHGIKIYDKTEYKEFGEYLVVRHGPERLAEGKRVFADDRKDNTNYMQRRQAELEEKYPEFKAAAERLYTFQRQFLNTWGVGTGLVSKQAFDKWGKRWQFYVPFNRAVEEKKRGFGAKVGFANQTSTINKAIGSGLDIIHPVDNIINNIVKMVTAGTRNNVMREITNSAQKLGADATFLEKVPAPLVKKTFNLTETKEELMDSIDETDISESDKEKVFDIIIGMDDILEQYSRGNAKKDVVTVMKNGKPEFWKINDKGLLDSLTNLSTTKIEGFIGAYATISRLMTATTTGLNIVWSVFSNLPRDLVTLYTYSETKNPIKLFGAMGSAYINKVRYDTGKEADPLYREYLAMGGGQQSAFTADIDLAKKARKKLSDKKTFGDYANPLEWLVYTSNLIEMGPRFATYKLMRQKGLNSQEAFYAAMDITVNFRRGGKAARRANYFIPFFNVSVQGLDKFRRWITAEEYRGKAERTQVVRNRTLAFFAASAALAALQYALTHGDEEEEKYYEQLSVYQKNSYWNIPTGDGKYFALPKPRELAVLTSLMERALEAGLGENEHAFDEFYAYASQNLLPKIASDLAQIPTNGLGESVGNAIGGAGILGVVVNMLANRDFLGRPIVSAGLQNLEPKDQYTNRTSKIAYWVGQGTGVSPTQIDYFFGQVLGGFWKYQKALFPVGEGNRDLTLGVKNTYVKDSQYSTDLVNWMYDKADKSNKAKNSNPEDMEKAITAKMDANMTTFYSRYYKLAKDKKETMQTRGARQAVLDMIYEYQKAADHGVLTEAQKAVYAVVEQQGNTALLPSAMQNTIKDANGKEHTLTDVDYVEFQTDYNRLYWEYVESNLGGATTDAQKAAILKAAKSVALEEAKRRTLGRIGAMQTAVKYGSADNDYVVSYKAQRDIANDDGKVTQDEVINILDRLLDDGLDSNAAYDIYLSEYSEDDTNSKKVATGAKQAGIDADTFLEYKYGLNNLEYEKGVNGARKKAITELLDSLGLTEEQYDYLFGTEYKTSSDKEDNGLFGGGFSGGFKSKW
jgi:N12 class adenine-specific DNA methylase